jgi:maleylpyruvate isomerase
MCKFIKGDEITLADIFLIPQVYNAKRFGVDMKIYPNICRVYENSLTEKVFFDASPEQIDA